jgi:hypothetical protein
MEDLDKYITAANNRLVFQQWSHVEYDRDIFILAGVEVERLISQQLRGNANLNKGLVL